MPLSEQTEARLAALHALWEHTIRAAIHCGLHAEDAAPVIATIQARRGPPGSGWFHAWPGRRIP